MTSAVVLDLKSCAIPAYLFLSW